MSSLNIEENLGLTPALNLAEELISSDNFPVVLCLGECGTGAIYAKMVAELLVMK